MAGLSGLGLHPDVVAGIKALHAAGYRLATLTNGSTQVAEKLFTDAGIRDSFDLLLSVEDAPAWKPGKASFEYAASACGTKPEQMLLVAVHPWYIHGASRAGIATAWIDRAGGPIQTISRRRIIPFPPCLSWSRPWPEETEVRYGCSTGTMDVVPALIEAAVPTRLVWGREDEFQKITFARRYTAQIPASDLVEVPGKHIPTEDSPEQVAEAILDHLAA